MSSSNGRARLALGIALSVPASGCMPKATFGYQYQLQQQFTGGEEPEPPPVEARQLLAAAKVVAFFPPDHCVNAGPTQGARRLQELRASCGVLMSKLERGAQSAGYEVVSWQNLRGGRPIDFAREAKVDVLFEVNEFEVIQLDDTSVQRTLRFFEVDDGIERPMVVSSSVAQTCRNYRGGLHQKVAWTGAIDIKTVQVLDGRDRWHYRKTEERAREVTYPSLTFSAKTRRHPLERLSGALGSLSAVAALELFLLPELITDDPTTPDDEGFDPSPWQWVTAVAAVGLFAGAWAAHKKLPIKPSVESVLCVDAHKDADPVVVHAGALSAEHRFTETDVGDSEAAVRRELGARMIDDFIKVLVEVRGTRS